jgi:hypothetical protein
MSSKNERGAGTGPRRFHHAGVSLALWEAMLVTAESKEVRTVS